MYMDFRNIIFRKDNNSMTKKLTAMLLAALMAIPFLSACGANGNGKSTDSQSDTNITEGGTYAEIDDYVKGLAEQYNFDGESFTIIGTGEAIYPAVREMNGNLQNETLYSRVLDIESVFGITVTFRESVGIDAGYDNTGAETTDVVTTDQMSGLKTYDLIEGNLKTCGAPLLNAGCLQPVNDYDMLDFTRSWWLNNLEEQFSVGGKLYFLTGKINPSHYSDGSCVLYNKDVAENFSLPDMYEFVREGTWTIDKLNEVASLIPVGSDVRRYMINASGALAIYFGGGFTLSYKDENDSPVIETSIGQSKVDYIDKLNSIFGDSSVKYDKEDPNYSKDFYDREVFENGQVLFWFDGIGRANDMRPYDVEFGILPIPKKDASQKNYISLSSDRAVYFAKDLKDPELTGVITEAMAALSEKHLEPAYYEKALKGRSTYDTDSKEVLDILYNSKVVDLEISYNWGKLGELVGTACVGYNDDYISDYASNTKLANRYIQSLLKKVAND